MKHGKGVPRLPRRLVTLVNWLYWGWHHHESCEGERERERESEFMLSVVLCIHIWVHAACDSQHVCFNHKKTMFESWETFLYSLSGSPFAGKWGRHSWTVCQRIHPHSSNHSGASEEVIWMWNLWRFSNICILHNAWFSKITTMILRALRSSRPSWSRDCARSLDETFSIHGRIRSQNLAARQQVAQTCTNIMQEYDHSDHWEWSCMNYWMQRTHFLAQAIDADPVKSFARDKFHGDKFGGEKLERDEMKYDKEQFWFLIEIGLTEISLSR